MKSALRIIVIILLVARVPPAAIADDLTAARSAIEAQYARLDAALARKDPTPFAGIAAPDIEITSANGDKHDLAVATRLWQEGLGRLKTVASRTVVKSAVAHGVTIRVVADSAEEAALLNTGVSVRSETTTHDSWIQIGADWRWHRSVEVSRKTWLNGKLFATTEARPSLPTAQRDAIVAELRARAIPFKTVAAGSGFDDLAALDAIVGDARIVALGEATHGTAEFFRMKHRIFEYLVERKGFTVIAFETPWPAVESVNRYVQGGEGTAASAIKGIFGIYQTREVLDLIEWMRAYNLKPGRSKLLYFTAFDMQGPEAAAGCVIDAVGRLGSAEGESMRRAYDGIDGMHGGDLYINNSGRLSDAERAAFGAKATAALKLLEARRDALLGRLTPAEYQRAHRCATIVMQAYIRGDKDIWTARDAAMAENVRWLAEVAHPGERIALWAHNTHVGASPYLWDVASMGMHLRKRFGQQMRILGFALDRGEVHAFQTGKTTSKGRLALAIPPAKADTPEALLKAAGVPRAILDLRTLPHTGALAAWLAEPQPIRSIGADFDPDSTFTHYQSSVLPKAFDALIFFEETTAARPLR